MKFATEVEAMIKDGQLEVHSDKDFHENPMEREDIKDSVEVASVKVIYMSYGNIAPICSSMVMGGDGLNFCTGTRTSMRIPWRGRTSRTRSRSLLSR